MNPICENCLYGVVLVNPSILQKMLDPSGTKTIECQLHPPSVLVLADSLIEMLPLQLPSCTCGHFQATP